MIGVIGATVREAEEAVGMGDGAIGVEDGHLAVIAAIAGLTAAVIAADTEGLIS